MFRVLFLGVFLGASTLLGAAAIATPVGIDLDYAVDSNEETITVNADGSSTSVTSRRLIVQTERGRASAGTQFVIYSPQSDRIEILQAYSETAGKRTILPLAAVRNETLTSNGEILSGDRQLVLPFTNVQVGSVVFFKTKRTRQPRMPGVFSRMIYPQEFSPINSNVFRFTSPTPLHFRFSDSQKLVGFKQIRSKPKFEYLLMLYKPGFANLFDADHPGQTLRPETQILVSNQKDWHAFSRNFTESYEKVLNVKTPPEMESLLRSVGKTGSDTDRIKRLLSKIQVLLAYRSDDARADGNYVPPPLAEILRTKTGDCKSFVVLSVFALRKMGFNAQVAGVNRGAVEYKIFSDPVIARPEIPGPLVSNHVIAVVTLPNGRKLWLDPTSSATYVGGIPADLLGSPVMISGEKQRRLSALPLTDPLPDLHQVTGIIDLRGMGSIKIEGRAEGASAFQIKSDLKSSIDQAAAQALGEIGFASLHSPPVDFIPDLKFNDKSDGTAIRYRAGRFGKLLKQNEGNSFEELPLPFPQAVERIRQFSLNGLERARLTAAAGYTSNFNIFTDRNLIEPAKSSCFIMSKWFTFRRDVRPAPGGVRVSDSLELKDIPVTFADGQELARVKLQLEECSQSVFLTGSEGHELYLAEKNPDWYDEKTASVDAAYKTLLSPTSGSLGTLKKAWYVAARAVDENPKDPRAMALLAMTIHELSQTSLFEKDSPYLAQSFKLSSRALDLLPDDPRTLMAQALNLAALKRGEESARAFKKAADLKANPFEFSMFRYRACRLDADAQCAAIQLEVARKTAPTPASRSLVSADLAFVYLKLDRAPEALEAFQEILKEKPLDAFVWQEFGRVQFAAQKIEEAEVSLRKSLHLSYMQSTADLLGEVKCYQGESQLMNKGPDYEAHALMQLKEGLKQNPFQGRCSFLLAEALMKQPRGQAKAEASEFYKRAIELWPDMPQTNSYRTALNIKLNIPARKGGDRRPASAR